MSDVLYLVVSLGFIAWWAFGVGVGVGRRLERKEMHKEEGQSDG